MGLPIVEAGLDYNEGWRAWSGSLAPSPVRQMALQELCVCLPLTEAIPEGNVNWRAWSGLLAPDPVQKKPLLSFVCVYIGGQVSVCIHLVEG